MENGRNIAIYLAGALIGGTRSNSASSAAEPVEVSSPLSGQWKQFRAGNKSWKVTTNFILPTVDDIDCLLTVGETYDLCFGSTEQEGGDPEGLRGSALLTKCMITATVGNIVQGTFEFQGNGELTGTGQNSYDSAYGWKYFGIAGMEDGFAENLNGFTSSTQAFFIAVQAGYYPSFNRPDGMTLTEEDVPCIVRYFPSSRSFRKERLGISAQDIKNLKDGLAKCELKTFTDYDTNMNNLLEQGVYPWCLTGRPAGEQGAFTLVVRKSFNVDNNNYYTVEQTAYGRAESAGKVFKRVLFQKTDGTVDYMDWINCSSSLNKLAFSGVLKADTVAQGEVDAIMNDLAANQQAWYIIGNSAGATSGGTVTFSSVLAKLVHPEDTRGVAANLGDLILFAKDANGNSLCKVIPLNDAKSPSDSFPGTYGILTPNDRMDIDNTMMNTYGESNMNNALISGFYPWCTLGRPAESTGAYTCVVQRSRQVDGNGYYSVMQTAFGREAELGKVYQRVIFYREDRANDNYGEWIDVSSGGAPDVTELKSAATCGYRYYGVLKPEDDSAITALNIPEGITPFFLLNEAGTYSQFNKPDGLEITEEQIPCFLVMKESGYRLENIGGDLRKIIKGYESKIKALTTEEETLRKELVEVKKSISAKEIIDGAKDLTSLATNKGYISAYRDTIVSDENWLCSDYIERGMAERYVRLYVDCSEEINDVAFFIGYNSSHEVVEESIHSQQSGRVSGKILYTIIDLESERLSDVQRFRISIKKGVKWQYVEAGHELGYTYSKSRIDKIEQILRNNGLM